MVPGLTMFHSAFRAQKFGYSSAIGLLLFIIAMSGTLIINRGIRPRERRAAAVKYRRPGAAWRVRLGGDNLRRICRKST